MFSAQDNKPDDQDRCLELISTNLTVQLRLFIKKRETGRFFLLPQTVATNLMIGKRVFTSWEETWPFGTGKSRELRKKQRFKNLLQ